MCEFGKNVNFMETIRIDTESPYEMTIGTGILENIAGIATSLGNVKKAAVVSDSNVTPLYAPTICSVLSDAGIEAGIVEFPAGEENKTLSSYGMIQESLAKRGISRSDLVVALGGGVAGDMAGFAAATYLRGIKYVQVPTSYLAAVDSSVGGKTAVDLGAGKNLCGAFWQPEAVLLSLDTFRTLPFSCFLDGSAEAFKASMIADPGLAEHVLSAVSSVDPSKETQDGLSDEFEQVIKGSVGIKAAVVAEDERDTGSRQLLNFGHTIGHAIEKLSGFAMSHGHAVARGMVAESRAAYKTGLTKVDASGYINEMLEKMGFDTEITFEAEDILDLASSDKKVRAGDITVVVPEDIGKCVLKKISLDSLGEYIEAGINA